MQEYQRVITSLRQAYGAAAAAERDAREKETFKVDERRRFLDLLRDRGATSLLEVGAGTGHDSLFFQEQGLRVLCTDLSPAMVELCRAKGLNARVADFLSLEVPPASFDAVYALNCLLHVPTPDLTRVLEAIGEVLVPGGLCYAGTWGGADEEGPMRDDHYPVPRFFAFRSDQLMSKTLAGHFRILSFTTFDPGGNHFQSFVLEKPIRLGDGKAPPRTRFGMVMPACPVRRMAGQSRTGLVHSIAGGGASYVAGRESRPEAGWPFASPRGGGVNRMGRFTARLCAAFILGISLVASTAGLASASAGDATQKAGPVAGTAGQATASIGHAIVPGFTSEIFGPNDDGSYPCTGPNAGAPADCTPTAISLPFPINFYGQTYESLYINNNGNLTFNGPLSDYTPQSLNQISVPMIAPFWADVDTRVGQTVTYGYQTVDGHLTLGVDYENVGCFSEIDSVTNTFQVLLIDRSDLGAGDWQIEFNYGPLTWDSGQASGGDAECLGGSPARAGYTSGYGPSCELPGSGVNGGLLDTNPITGLIYNDYGSSTPGQYIFNVSGASGVPNGCGGYFALGDSYSSGEGTDNYNYAGAPCDRGSDAWPSLLSAEYAAVPQLSPNTFVACSGATSTEQAPQVTALQNWTRENGPPALVTVTAGGDDLQFSNVLKTCVAGTFLGDDGLSCLYILNHEVNVLDSNSFFTHMVRFYQSIASAAGGPDHVVVVGYPNLFPLPSLSNDVTAALNCYWWMGTSSPQILTAFAAAQADLNDALSGAAAIAGVRYIELGDLFAGHELCTSAPLINALRPFYSGAGHPNIKGQQAIASYVASQLGYLEGNGTGGSDAQHGAAASAHGAGAKSAGAKHPGPAATDKSVPVKTTATATAVVRPAAATRAAAGTPLTLDAALVNGWVGEPYTGFVWGSGGTAPYTWSVTSGALPAGLSLDSSTGIISGTPTAAGTTGFTVTATDASSPAETASEHVSITIAATSALSVSVTSLPTATAGQAYSATMAATGGVPVYSWSVTSGTLPDGLSLDPDTGIISGTPTTAGSSTFTVEASDAASPTANTATKTLTLTVDPSTAALTLGTPALPGATAGETYDAALPSTGGTAPLAWSISTGALPPGLTLDPVAGVISGIPTQAGTFSFGVAVSDAASNTSTETVSITVAAGTAASIATTTLPGATAGSDYSQQLLGSGGVPDYSWSVTSGSLPDGLSLDPSSGIISGTPTTAGSYGFTVTLTDSATPTAGTASQAYTMTVAAAPVNPAFSISDNSASGVVGLAYQAALIPDNGTSPYTFAVTSGALPTGLSLDPNEGVISGTPTAAGTFTATISATDSSTPTAQTATDTVTITITTPGTLAISTSTLPNGAVGSGYATPVAATGGTGADSFAVTSGSLPAGLALDPASGVIYGVPTTAGASTFTVTVTDSATPTADTASATLTLTVGTITSVSISTTSLPDATQGIAYSQILTASGGTEPYSWAVTTGSLPDGLTLNASTGVLSGTPTNSGSFPFTVTATDSSTPTAETATSSYTLTVDSSGTLMITSSTLSPDTATVGVAYSATLDAAGGTAPYNWAVTSGALPDGLSIDPATGAIAGTPTSGGTFPFTVTVTDSSTPTAQTVSQSYTITVAGAQLSQSISFTPPATGTYGGTATLSATGGGSGNPVTFSVDASSDPGVCAVSGTDGATLTYTGVGNCAIDANQAGNAGYAAASQVQATIPVGVAAQSISFTAPASGTVGGSVTLSATGGGSGNPVVFSVNASSGSGVCAVSGTNGATLTYTAAGNCVIDANQTGSADYSAAPQVQHTITVTSGPAATTTTLSISPTSAAWEHERAVTFTVKVTAPHGTPGGTVKVVSGSRTLCTGTLAAGRTSCVLSSATLLAPGSYSVKASYPGSTGFTASTSAAVTFKVTKEATKSAVALSATTITSGKEKRLVVTATVTAQYAGTAAGTITITAGRVTLCKNKALTKGKATCSPASNTTLPVGSYNVIAAYSGNVDFAASTSPAKSLKVSKPAKATITAVEAAALLDHLEADLRTW